MAGTNPNLLVFDYGGDVSAPHAQYTGHTGNVTAVGYQKEGKWMYSASEDKSVKVWDVRVSGCQRGGGFSFYLFFLLPFLLTSL